jgi:hypothetical protein
MLEEFRDILFETRDFFEDAGPQDYFLLCRFWILMSLVPALEFTIIAFLFNIPINFPYEASGILLSIIIFVTSFLSLASGGLVFNFLYAGIIHLVSRLFGCRGFKKTLTSVIISSIPNLLVGLCLQMLFTLGLSYFSSFFADYFFFIIALIAFMAIMWLWSLVINIIGIATLHEISFIKATVSVFIIPLIIVGSVMAYLTRMSLNYVKEIMTSETTAILIGSASCVNGRIVINLANQRDEALNGDSIKVFIDDVDESQYFKFGNIPSGLSRAMMSTRIDQYSSGQHKIEVRYRSYIAGTIIEC